MKLEELIQEKLTLEIKELKRAWYVRPANLISIVSLAFAVFQFQSAEVKIEAAQSLVQETEEKDEYLQEKQLKVLEAEKSLIKKKQQTIQVQATGRIMDVWAYGVEASVVEAVKDHLTEQGNEVGFGGLLGFRPSWLALQPTVFYYQNTSRDTAQEIAEELKALIGIEFLVSRGAGLGVNPNEKGVTYFVHITN